MKIKIKRNKIFLNKEQKNKIKNSVKSYALTEGPDLKELKFLLLRRFKFRYAILTTNCFFALYLILKYFTKFNYKKVLIPAIGTCFSIANAARSLNLKILFRDVDQKSLGLLLTKNDKKKKLIVIAPNFLGKICNYVKNKKIKNHKIIEDNAQAFISRTKIKTNSDFMVFSFCATKIINGINGGAILTNNLNAYKYLEKISNYKKQKFQEKEVRMNCAMSNINAACIHPKIKSEKLVRKKLNYIYKHYAEACSRRGLDYIKALKDETLSKFIILASSKKKAVKIKKLFNKRKIEVGNEFMWCCHSNLRKNMKFAKNHVNNSVSLPFYESLKRKEIFQVKKTILKIK